MPVEIFFLDAETKEPVPLLLLDALVIFFMFARLNEVLSVGLLKLAAAEKEVARGDFVAESFANLGDTERNLHTTGV